ncbi:protein asteroid homolog 1-like [Stylophora pistillata]|uniref:protein asteroid homolog 1-like n=1 Tax=Stylophora pistillata TaxID=50429 RepID=UPI000C045DE3|nr:protein asteroid homolog 1-like [Stylophora pistillata]
MGVHGLLSFVEKIEQLWETIELRRDTKLVIDGSALYKSLYADSCLDRRCGGQYKEFYDIIINFFNALKSVGVESFVVLDGATNDNKLETHKKRSEERIKKAYFLAKKPAEEIKDVFVCPLLLNFVFVQALRDLDVKFAVSDREADAEIAYLANYFQCPVLSNDSDFCIFDVIRGFIPISSFKWHSLPLKARIFHRAKLAEYFGIRTELLALFASLVGNDYATLALLRPFHQSLPGKSGKTEEKFRAIINLILQAPASEEEAVEFVLQHVSKDCPYSLM